MLPVHGDLCTAQRIPCMESPRIFYGLPLYRVLHTTQRISWEVADSPIDFLFTGYSHWPENLMGSPRTWISHGVLFFYRGLYTLTFTDCMHLTDNPLHFNKRDWATCRNGNVQKGQNVQKWKWRAKQNKTRPDYTETHIPNNLDEPT